MYKNTLPKILSVRGRYSVEIADNQEEIEKCLRLRYEIFSDEMGAQLKSGESGLDKDQYDPYCIHLMVTDHASDKVIATTRLLTSEAADLAGGFYSETEFNLSNIIRHNYRYMEVGRTCIHADYRVGSALPLLWQGIAYIVMNKDVDYMFGCASIPYYGDAKYISSIMHYIKQHHFSDEGERVKPHIPLKGEDDVSGDVILPTLLKGYLKQGAQVCGEPYWDAQFGVADVFVLLDCDRIAQRYQKHFVERATA
jgi:putative hemolysin